jgi:hypothetical protein
VDIAVILGEVFLKESFCLDVNAKVATGKHLWEDPAKKDTEAITETRKP